jgi:6-pyruvoyltetrahydropterin/6-carboxytetrahydropterin synthase
MAHALYGYDGPCKNIHGHSYSLCITISGNPNDDNNNPKNGMVMDFGELKSIANDLIIKHFDHSLVLNENSPHREFNDIGLFEKVVFTPFQPTCENMLIYFVNIIKNNLPENVSLFSAKLRETETSYAEWHQSDNLN